MQRYLEKVRELLHDASGFIAQDLLVESRRLVDHGEAPLGVVQLAWIIHDERILVPESIIQRSVNTLMTRKTSRTIFTSTFFETTVRLRLNSNVSLVDRERFRNRDCIPESSYIFNSHEYGFQIILECYSA